MDLRVQSTRKSIFNEFLQLRAKQPLEKISVKELSDLAVINKATFYLYFKDIYELAESLEYELIDTVLKEMPEIDLFASNPSECVFKIAECIKAKGKLFEVLFSNGRQEIFISQLEKKVKSVVYEKNPELRSNLKYDLMLTVLMQGVLNALLGNDFQHRPEVVSSLGEIADSIVINCK